MINRLCELLEYRPKTGELVWRVTRTGTARKGCLAGSLRSDGYRYLSVDGRRYMAHRVIWVMHNGEIPGGLEIDHINCDRADNRLENLRLATRQQNLANQRRLGRKLLPKGVSRLPGKITRPYQAQIKTNGAIHYLGTYACPTAAHLAYIAAAKRLFGAFSRAG